MCGRFALSANAGDIEKLVPGIKTDISEVHKFNIAPSQDIVTVTSDYNTKLLRWGLIPSWSKDPSIGNKMINARAETISEKPSFRNLIMTNRCLIIASGYYEWKTMEDGSKVPYYIKSTDELLMTFAGLWTTWQSPNKTTLDSCTIITIKANQQISSIHNRMPVVISNMHRDAWLNKSTDKNAIIEILSNDYNYIFDFYRVSKAVNNPIFDQKECIMAINL